MNIRYPITPFFRQFFEQIREEKLGYSYGNMEKVFNYSHRGSSFYDYSKNMNPSKPRWEKSTKTVDPFMIKSLFLVEYNCERFHERLPRMREIVAEKIESGIFKPDTTLKEIFGDQLKKVNGIEVYSPPVSLFEDKKYKFNCDIRTTRKKGEFEVFTESDFAGYEDYISMEILDDDDNNLSDEQYLKLCKYISRRVSELFRECKTTERAYQYWLYATKMTYQEVELTPPIWEYIKVNYFKKGEQELTWRKIYTELSNKGNKIANNVYNSILQVYFDKKSMKEPISKENLPIMHVNYDISTLNNLKRFEIRRECAVNGSLRLIDLFMLFYLNILEQENNKDEKINETVAFNKTCIELVRYSMNNPFHELGIVDIPEGLELVLDPTTCEFINTLNSFFARTDLPKSNSDINIFEENMTAANLHFMKAISVDFKFIKNLTIYSADELRDRIKQTVEKFKDENIL